MKTTVKRILVVDDDELLREFYNRVLSGRGYEVACAANGDEAITLLAESAAYGLIIVDLLMPVRTGWELIEHVRTTPAYAQIPLLAITGLATSSDELEQVKKACDGVMLKGDFDLARFTETVDRLVKA